jgi:hypothetical protein
MKGLLGILLAVLSWGGAVELSEHARGSEVEKEELFYYPSGRFLRQAVLGYDHAAATLAWLRAVQYYGEHVIRDRRFDMMYHVCDVITDLDPGFEEPYVFGSFVLLTEGKRPLEGMRLLDKGRMNNPYSWKIHFESGFIEYIAWQDHEKAAEYFAKAASLPGAPEQAERFAAYVTYKAGDYRTSLSLWSQLAENSRNPEVRRKAEAKVQEILALVASEEAGMDEDPR